jgi:hypothetical protein
MQHMLTKKDITLMVVDQYPDRTYTKYFTGKPGKALDKRADDATADIIRTHGTRNARFVISQVIWQIEG